MQVDRPIISVEPLLVDSRGAAGVLGISLRHFLGLCASGRIGPMPRRLGRRKLYIFSELKSWVDAGLPVRQIWVARGAPGVPGTFDLARGVGAHRGDAHVRS